MNPVERAMAIGKAQVLYLRAVRFRGHNSVKAPTALQVVPIVDALGDEKLLDLFIESQFAKMPGEWCKEKFGTLYPPANVVFGGEAMSRYREYVSSGQRVPCW